MGKSLSPDSDRGFLPLTGEIPSYGVPKLGTRQMPILRILLTSSPSCIWPRTPILSIIKPFSEGREESTSGRERLILLDSGSEPGMTVVGVGVGEGLGLVIVC